MIPSHGLRELDNFEGHHEINNCFFQFLLCDIRNGRDDLTEVLSKLIRWAIIEGTYGSNGVILFMGLDSGIKFGNDFFVTPKLIIFFR